MNWEWEVSQSPWFLLETFWTAKLSTVLPLLKTSSLTFYNMSLDSLQPQFVQYLISSKIERNILQKHLLLAYWTLKTFIWIYWICSDSYNFDGSQSYFQICGAQLSQLYMSLFWSASGGRAHMSFIFYSLRINWGDCHSHRYLGFCFKQLWPQIISSTSSLVIHQVGLIFDKWDVTYSEIVPLGTSLWVWRHYWWSDMIISFFLIPSPDFIVTRLNREISVICLIFYASAAFVPNRQSCHKCLAKGVQIEVNFLHIRKVDGAHSETSELLPVFLAFSYALFIA